MPTATTTKHQRRTSKAPVENERVNQPTTLVASSNSGGGGNATTPGTGRGGGEGRASDKTVKEAAFSSAFPSSSSSPSSALLTVTMESGTAEDAPRAVWLGRLAAVMEARGDRDGAVRLYGEASDELTGKGKGGDGSDNNSRFRDDGDGKAVPAATGATEKGFSALNGGGGGVCCRGGGEGRDLFPYSARAHHLASMIERSYRRHFRR